MQAWGLSDPGMVRTENQDAFAVKKISAHGLLAVVCDGMGGANAGNVASGMALDVFCEEILRGCKPSMSGEKVKKLLCSAAELANKAVYEQAAQDAEYSGMGTTLVAAVILGKKACIINIGDSRAYHVGSHGIRRVTTDHSFVQMMVQRGDISQAEALNHPGKNLITRAIGTESAVEGDLFTVELTEGDSLLLCSDGLSNVVAEQEMLYEIVHGNRKTDCCQRLVEIARKRGAPDNVTALLISE